MPGEPLTLADLDAVTLTASEAFAMHRFLVAYCGRLSKPSADLATITSATEVEADLMSSDPAALSDWLSAVNEVFGQRPASS